MLKPISGCLLATIKDAFQMNEVILVIIFRVSMLLWGTIMRIHTPTLGNPHVCWICQWGLGKSLHVVHLALF